MGIVIPNEVAKELRLSPGDEILADLQPTGGVREAFGSLKHWKVDPQKLKEEARRGW